MIEVTPADQESEIYYTLDGSTPSLNSNKYTGKIDMEEGKVTIKAVAYSADTQKYSPATSQNCDVSKRTGKSWAPQMKKQTKFWTV